LSKSNLPPIGSEIGRDIVIAGLVGKPKRFRNTYCLRLHPNLARRLQISCKRQCVVTAHRRDCSPFEGLVSEKDIRKDEALRVCLGLSATTGDKPDRSRTRIRVIASVIEDLKLHIEDPQLRETHLEIDETLRTALGIQMDESSATAVFEVRVSSLPGTTGLKWLSERLCDLFGYRYVYARIGVGFVADIDKPIGRLPAFSFPLLGVPDGGRLICEIAVRDKQGRGYVIRKTPIRTFCLSPEIQSDREKKEKEGKERRFRSSKNLLGLDNELPLMFVGHDMRKEFDSGDLDVVRLRRSIPYILSIESINSGVAAIAAFTTFVTPVFLLTEKHESILRALSVAAALIAATFLIWLRVRSSIK
jgi:hypothetical protein